MQPVPVVSILTVVHNGMPYLPETVDSVLAQTFQDFEYLIVDDGSTDGTADYLSSLSDQRIRVLRRERIGLIAVRNLSVSEAVGEYAAIIDADDVARPHRLQTQLQFLQQNRECVVVGSAVDLIDEAGQNVGNRRFPASDPAIRFQMLFGCPFLNPTTMYRRQAMIRAGAYVPEFPNAEDYHLFARLAQQGTLANLTEPLTQYRLHAASMTSRTSEEQARLCQQIATNWLQQSEIPASAEVLPQLYRFLQTGTVPDCRPEDLVGCYRSIRQWFSEQFGSDPELQLVFESIQQRLRWHCLEHASASWKNPAAAWHWVRLAGRFDPENSSLSRIAGRGMKTVFRRSLQTLTNNRNHSVHASGS